MDHKVITIARSYGSGGRTLGKLLSERLNMKYYDYDLIRMASEESGIHESLFGRLDEKVKGRTAGIFGKSENVYNGEVLPPSSDKYTSADNIFNIQAEIIRKVADEGPCIIIGRCADFILKDRPNVIRLYFYASRQNCIDRVRRQNGGTDKDIINMIQKTDKYRAEYYRYHTGRDWQDLSNYDFCLNTSSLSYEKLAEVVEAYINIYEG